jgi:hypothetical protein
MVEIGAAGYHAPDHPVLDLVGLVSPEALAANGRDADELDRLGTRYVVDVPLFHQRFPVLRQLDAERWRVLTTFDDPASGRGTVAIWQRRQPPVGEPPAATASDAAGARPIDP